VLVVVFITKSADRHFDQSELSKSVELIALNFQHCRKNTSATAADQNQKRPENIFL
jgi:sensor domain CHASE-containing protein